MILIKNLYKYISYVSFDERNKICEKKNYLILLHLLLVMLQIIIFLLLLRGKTLYI